MIELRKVSKTYRSGSQEITALKDISLEIPGGAFCLLIGPSGCGKSTLLNLVGGLDFPTGGEILIGGVPVSRMTDREWTLYRREKIGVVFQFFNLLPSLSVNDNVSLPLALNGVSGKEAGHRVAELLEKVGLAGKGARLPRDLSGGEQQRAAIARAVVHSPSLVLAGRTARNPASRIRRRTTAGSHCQSRCSFPLPCAGGRTDRKPRLQIWRGNPHPFKGPFH